MSVEMKYVEDYATIKGGDGEVIHCIASDASRDLDGEIIAAGCFEKSLPHFVEKGSILSCHQHRLPDGSPPMIGVPVDAKYVEDVLHVDLKLGKGELSQKWQIAKDDGTWRQLSVGFVPEVGDYETRDGAKGYVHKEARLIELSGVPVGSNTNTSLRGALPPQMMEEIQKQFKALIDGLAHSKEELLAELRDYIDELAVPDARAYAAELLGGDNGESKTAEALKGLQQTLNKE